MHRTRPAFGATCETFEVFACFLFCSSVSEFSKKTGDYPSLSATDIKVLALTYQLEQEHVGVGHLKREPERKVMGRTSCCLFDWSRGTA